MKFWTMRNAPFIIACLSMCVTGIIVAAVVVHVKVEQAMDGRRYRKRLEGTPCGCLLVMDEDDNSVFMGGDDTRYGYRCYQCDRLYRRESNECVYCWQCLHAQEDADEMGCLFPWREEPA